MFVKAPGHRAGRFRAVSVDATLVGADRHGRKTPIYARIDEATQGGRRVRA